MSNNASTEWQEQIGPDEAQRFASHAQRFASIQERKSARYGKGRTLHRKQIIAARGSFEVLDGIASYAQHGLFATAHEYEVLVRLSNGGFDRAPDHVPDIRGFAMRVLGVQGESALGTGAAVSQDFLLINHEVFAFPNSSEFVDFAEAASNGNGAMFKFVFKRYGLFGGVGKIASLLRTATKRFSGFATEALFTAVPMACGPFAARARMVPSVTNGEAKAQAKQDWGADFSERLGLRELHWDFQLQPYSNERVTPIEDPTVVWPTPYTTVARLMLPKQDTNSDEGRALSESVERSAFDPWQALAEHRPLGEIQRARKVVYFHSQKAREAIR